MKNYGMSDESESEGLSAGNGAFETLYPKSATLFASHADSSAMKAGTYGRKLGGPATAFRTAQGLGTDFPSGPLYRSHADSSAMKAGTYGKRLGGPVSAFRSMQVADDITGLGSEFPIPTLYTSHADSIAKRAGTYGKNLQRNLGRMRAPDKGLAGLGDDIFGIINTGLDSLKNIGTEIKKGASIVKQIGAMVKPPKQTSVTIKPYVANVTGSPYGVPTGSTKLEPQIPDQSTVDGVKTAITKIPTNYLVMGGIGLAVIGTLLFATRRPAY